MNCPCCSGKLLQHFSRNGLYWHCQDCRLNVPVSQGIERLLFEENHSEKHHHNSD